MAKVLGAYGPHGELRVQPLSRFPERLRQLRRVYVGERFQPATIRSQHRRGQSLLIRLDDVRTREEAKLLGGSFLYVPEDEAIPLPPGEYFVHQLIGLRVVTTDGRQLGVLREVLQTGSNDVYIVSGPLGEVLLPATREVIQRISLDAGTMEVQLIPGLVDDG